jgi:SpoVK/Ycf46/Vps4 family AAA+-type ATPase
MATDGYSGSDIKTLLSNASARALSKAQQATHFHFNQKKDRWFVCNPGFPDAQKKKFEDICQKVQPPLLSCMDIELSFQAKTVSERDILKYKEFEEITAKD